MPTIIYGPNGKLAARETPGWKRVQQEMASEADHFDQLLHARAFVIASNDSPQAWRDRTPYSWEILRLMEIMTEVCGLSPELAATELLRAIGEQGQAEKFDAETPETTAGLLELAGPAAPNQIMEGAERSDVCKCCEVHELVEEHVTKTFIPSSFSTEKEWFDFSTEVEGDVVNRISERMTEPFTEIGIDIFEDDDDGLREDPIRERISDFYDIPGTVLNAVIAKVNCRIFEKQLEDLGVIEKTADATTA